MRNPPASSVLATYAYLGPPVATCGTPTIAHVDASGSILTFLTARFDSITGTLSISLPNKSFAIKGTYILSTSFTLPGEFNFPLGLSLTVFDVCDNSYFVAAPSLSLNNQIYYTNQGNLDVTATYLNDFITRTTSNTCGTYTIDI